MSRTGKIARLPASLREEVNRRLHDGAPAREIIAWLHTQPETLRVLDEYFGEEPITPQNLSEWKQGGYQEWLARRDRVENLKTLSSYAMDLAKAGGSVTEGAAAIAGGRILELLETLEEEKLGQFVSALASLRNSEATALNAQTQQKRLAQKERELKLAESRFQRETAELFLKWFADQKAREIAESSARKEVQMDLLVELMFGKRPEQLASSD
jgi:hypothetical protein